MAAPHVAGAAALLLQSRPDLTPKEIAATLKVRGTRGVVSDRKGSENLLLYVGPQPCRYSQYGQTAVDEKGTGGKKLKKKNYANENEYLMACKKHCNEDSKCKGFVDDPTESGGPSASRRRLVLDITTRTRPSTSRRTNVMHDSSFANQFARPF